MSQLSAHRGGPEARLHPNSLEAISAACELGVDLIEFDVRVTHDGNFIVYHADRLAVDGRMRLIADVDLADIVQADPGVPTLPSVLDLIRGRAIAHVDLKDAREDLAIADLCEARLGASGFVITTLHDHSVRRIRTARPHLIVGLSLAGVRARTGRRVVVGAWSELFPQARVRACDANLLAINHRLARFGLLGWAHRHQLPVLLWTLNTEKRIRAAQRDHRVWAYTTDFPRLALRLADAA